MNLNAGVSIENQHLRYKLQQAHEKLVQVEMDHDYLKTTVEQFVPYFANLEKENAQLKIQLRSKETSAKLGDQCKNKNRKLELKIKEMEKVSSKTVSQVETTNKVLEDKIKLLRLTNTEMQKKQ